MNQRDRNRMRRRSVSEGRQGAFYLGTAIMVIGGLTFLSVFFSAATSFGDFSNFEADARSQGFRAILGITLLGAGQFVRSVGQRGLAGSGLVLDPERAREDLEPFSRQGGGMLADGLDEVGIDLGSSPPRAAMAEPSIMIRCLACDHLNEEDSKFCQDCGAPMRAHG